MIMAILRIMISKFKSAIRSKELYVYIIGFPLIFMLIYGSFAWALYSEIQPITIGYLNMDKECSYKIGNSTYHINYGEDFYRYLKELRYEETNVNVFKIVNVSSREEAESRVGRLEIAAAIQVPIGFSNNLTRALESFTYYSLAGILNSRAQEAYENGNYEEANKYWSALAELSEFANASFSIRINLIGDPTYSKAMQAYELCWKYLVSYVISKSKSFTNLYAEYLSKKYNISIEFSNETLSLSIEQSFQVAFHRIGGGGLKESFTKMYFAILVPGQIIQSVMMSGVSVISMIYVEIERRLIERIKLTKVSSPEYIGGVLLSWGVVALFQSTILLLSAIALGYVTLTADITYYFLSIVVIVTAGILTASFSLTVASFVRSEISNAIIMIMLITLSLIIAGYFPIPNPIIGELFGVKFAALDIAPWRRAIIALRKLLMLTSIYTPIDVLPDLLILFLWTIIYTIISFITFSLMILKKRE